MKSFSWLSILESQMKRGDTFYVLVEEKHQAQLCCNWRGQHVKRAEKSKKSQSVSVSTKYSVYHFRFVDRYYDTDLILDLFNFLEESEAPLMLTWT